MNLSEIAISESKTPNVRKLLVFGGVVFLQFFGWRSWKKSLASESESAERKDKPLWQLTALAASTTLFNPHALLDTVAVIGTSAIVYSGHAKVCLTVTCMLVSFVWFISLMCLGKRFGQLPVVIRYAHRIAALSLWGCAILLLHVFVEF